MFSTGNEFPVQVTSCNMSSREPVEGFVLFLIGHLLNLSHIKIHPTHPFGVVQKCPDNNRPTLALTFHNYYY